uniref:RNA-binding S4 domain-containing protein n=1 Tax=Chenopodium quinoa TaxID=63459 RepID=A0A803LJH8_CHEQI
MYGGSSGAAGDAREKGNWLRVVGELFGGEWRQQQCVWWWKDDREGMRKGRGRRRQGLRSSAAGRGLGLGGRLADNPPLLSSPKLSAPRILHALPTTRSFQSVAEGGKQKKAVVVKTTKKKMVEEPRYSKAARRFYNEKFGEKPQRLAKVLAAAGVASRRSSEELIFQGKVTVNGSVCDTPQTKVDPAKDIIYVKGNRLPKKLPSKVYLALNKPKGYICSSGEKEPKSILSLCADFLKSWVNEGRNHEVRELVKKAGLEVVFLFLA